MSKKLFNKKKNKSQISIVKGNSYNLIKIGMKGNFQEFQDEPQRNSDNRMKSDGANNEFSTNCIQKYEGRDHSQDQTQSNFKKSKFEGKAGHPKVIKSQNTQQMTDILESVNDAERKKVFETIHERIVNSKMTIETDQDNELNHFEFISKIKGKDSNIKINNKQNAKIQEEFNDYAFEERLDGKYDDEEDPVEGIGSSNLYGGNVSRHVRQIS